MSFIYTEEQRITTETGTILTQLMDQCSVAISYRSLSPQEVVAYSCASVNGSGSRTYNGAIRGETLLHCISVTDLIKINEQNKSIDIGPLYLQTEFEAI